MNRMVVSTTAALVLSTSAWGQNLLLNGGLEGATPAPCNGFSTLGGGSSNIPGWTVVGPNSIDWIWHNAAGGGCCDWSPEGDRFIDLNGSPAQNGGAITQSIPTTPGRRYRISLLALANGCCAPVGTPKTMLLTTGADSSEHTVLTLWSSEEFGVECDWSQWTRIEREWTAATDSTVIELRSLVLSNAGGVFVDDISVTEVGPRDLHVPAQYPTLAQAIAASAPGDRVVVAPGVHAWTPAVIGHTLTVEGSGGAMETRFEGNGEEPVPLLECAPGSASTVVLRNLHIARGRGVHASSGALTIERCMFTANLNGLLIESSDGSFLGATVTSCAFVGNGGGGTQQAGGVGVYVLEGAPGVALDSCMFLENQAHEGGGLHVSHSASTAAGCVFARNSALTFSGGAIARWWGHVAIPLSSCSFIGNTAVWSGTENWNCCVDCTSCSFDSTADTTTDCNSNLIPDAAEMLVDASVDANKNGLLDACEPTPCPGDADASGSIDGVDLAIVLQNWGAPSAKYPGADINADGEVNGSDLAIVLAGWGACP